MTTYRGSTSVSSFIDRAIAALAAVVIGFTGLATVSSGPARGAGKAARIPVAVFAQLPQASNIELSPDGQFFAMVVPYKGIKHVLIQRLDRSKPPTVVPPFENLEINWLSWANNKRLLISFKFEGTRYGIPTVETRLMAVNRDGHNFIPIVKPKNFKSTNSKIKQRGYQPQIQDDIIDYLWQDPDHIMISVDGDMDGEDEVRIIDVNTGSFKEIGMDFRGVQNWQTDQTGEIRFATGYDVNKRLSNKRVYMYRSPESGQWTDYSKSAAFQRGLMPVGFSRDPHQVYMSGLNESGTWGIVKYDIGSDKAIAGIYSDSDYSYGNMIVDLYSREIRGLSYIDDRPHRIFFSKKDKKRQRILDKALKGTYNRVVSSSADGGLHMVMADSDVDPGVYYLFDQKKMRLSPFALYYKGIEPELMSPMKAVTYAARDKLKIHAYLTVPRGRQAKNLPLVVLPHGGPGARDYIHFDYWVQLLASRGYAVFQPNYRGSTGYRAAFLRAGYRNWGLKMQDDVTDGVKWLIDQGIADARRICIVGGSYGGYAAMMGAIKTPGLYRCAASINGVADLKAMIYADKKFIGGSAWSKSIGDLGKDSDQLRDTSPLQQTGRIEIPMLLVHARDDRRVPYKQSQNMAARLKKSGVPYRYVELKDGGHTLDTEQARLTAFKALEKFLAEYL